jgi:thiol-disulfide isomerase/thioredoxin
LALVVVAALGLTATVGWLRPHPASATSPVASDAGAAASCDADGLCPVGALESGASEEPPKVEPEGGANLLFFWGTGCAHCEEARPFVERLARERPELRVHAIEVRRDPIGRQRFIDTMQRLHVTAVGVPTFVMGERFVAGFRSGVTETELERLVDEALAQRDAGVDHDADGVQTKLLGWLSARELGLPIFTIVLGLLDGFNPCAMWVLLFLLATLAGQRNRRRMALTAGTFVVVSGAVYFAFMAAWLSVFLLTGITRPVQLVLGALALGMAAVNVKDFFAFGRGLSLSIPESAKPGIYARVRSVLRGHGLVSSMLGIGLLAVLVNLVELLCTAGLPAIYTSILARRELSTVSRLAYLGLYNLAYVADDALMVTLAVVTLSRRRLAETAGRWLKLASGAVMLILGLLLILRPEWLP